MRKIQLSGVCLTMILSVVCTLQSSGRQLSPTEALDNASKMMQVKRIAAPAISRTAPDPVFTATSGDLNTLYIFNVGDSNGYVVVAADDVAIPVLGYSDRGNVNPDNIPESMRWWIDNYSHQIATAAHDSATNMPLKASPVTTRQPIAPMVTTLWNQDSPYNDKCPSVNNQRCVTGCVATALAQKMKYHNWPQKGAGTNSYTWNNSTLTLDFSSITFDWKNMLDSYTATSSTAQQEAVATLMYAAGIASDMDYGVNASSANSYYAARGLINYLNYDKGTRVLSREFYPLDEWIDIVYTDLAEGRPVVYAGQSSSGGHCFVCDGYSSNNYFHFNWGWGGMSDGYYLLTALDPTSQGIGGSGAGYNEGQEIIVNCKPSTGNSVLGLTVLTYGNFSTYQQSYSEGSNVLFMPTGADQNAFFNMSLGDVEFSFGVKLTATDGTVTYAKASSPVSLEMMSGVGGYYISTSALPTSGVYTVTPAAYYNGQWSDIKVAMGMINSLKLTIDNDTYTFAQIPVDIDLTASNIAMSSPTYSGYDCQISADITNNGTAEFYGQLTPVLCTVSGTSATIVARGDAQTLDIQGGETVPMTAIVNFGSVTAGQYYFGLITSSNSIVGSLIAVNILTAPSGSTTAYALNLSSNAGSSTNSSKPVELKAEGSTFSYTLQCQSGAISGSVGAYVFYDQSTVVMPYGSQFVTLASGQQKNISMSGSLSTLNENHTYIMVPWNFSDNAGGQIPGSLLYFTVKKDASGIDNTTYSGQIAYTLTITDGQAVINAPTKIKGVSMCDMTGKCVLTCNEDNNSSLTVDISAITPGIYIVTVVTDEGRQTFKIVK